MTVVQDEFTQSEGLPAADAAEVIGSFGRFLDREAAPLYSRPEFVPGRDQIVRLAEAARSLGYLPGDEPAGLGLWEQPETAAGLRLSAGYLERTAEISASLACLFHARALAACAGSRLGLRPDTAAAVHLPVARGWGRGAIGRLTGRSALPAEDAGLLQPLFLPVPEPYRGLIVAFDEPGALIAPVLDRQSGGVTWVRLGRAAFELEARGETLGLEGLRTWELRVPPAEAQGGRETVCGDPQKGLGLFRRLWSLELLGQMAIAAGTVRTALRKARQYASERRQGGRMIAGHPAVCQLIGEGEAALVTAGSALRGVTGEPLPEPLLTELMALRAVVHPLLCRAATNCLQVFGGYGYMRDYGMEKILRDNLQLRILAGSPADFFLALGSEPVQ